MNKKSTLEQVKRARQLIAQINKVAEDSEPKFIVPTIPNELRHATTEREKAYLSIIVDLIERLKRDFATGFEHRDQFVGTEKNLGAYLFIDGDGLKKINDQTGDHSAGDAAIKAIAAGISQALRSRDDVEIARMGGDEFAIHIKEVSLSTGFVIAKRILDSIRNQNISDYYKGSNPETKERLKDWPLSASIGVGRTQAEADGAMYKAKEKGRGRVEYFKEEKAASSHARLTKLAMQLKEKK